MSGVTNLKVLMKSMRPELQDGIFVFCFLPKEQRMPTDLSPIMTFEEHEGTTFIARKEDVVQAGLSHQFESRQITLMVHSSLDAIGFLATITDCLAKAGISVNPVSAFYHDHLFVPTERADQALALLTELAKMQEPLL
jgi:hypothetical protein